MAAVATVGRNVIMMDMPLFVHAYIAQLGRSQQDALMVWEKLIEQALVGVRIYDNLGPDESMRVGLRAWHDELPEPDSPGALRPDTDEAGIDVDEQGWQLYDPTALSSVMQEFAPIIDLEDSQPPEADEDAATAPASSSSAGPR